MRFRTGALAVGVLRYNHHTTSYNQVSNLTVDLLPLPRTSPGLQPHLSTKWTGQTRLTNSQGTNHKSWMVRCSLALQDLAVNNLLKNFKVEINFE